MAPLPRRRPPRGRGRPQRAWEYQPEAFDVPFPPEGPGSVPRRCAAQRAGRLAGPGLQGSRRRVPPHSLPGTASAFVYDCREYFEIRSGIARCTGVWRLLASSPWGRDQERHREVQQAILNVIIVDPGPEKTDQHKGAIKEFCTDATSGGAAVTVLPGTASVFVYDCLEYSVIRFGIGPLYWGLVAFGIITMES